MNEKSSIQMSQGYDVLPPKTGKAYPILCEEWEYLKRKVDSISDRPMFYHTVGSILLGASISTLMGILCGSFPNPDPGATSSKLIIAWAVVFVGLSVGVMAIYFAHEQRKVSRTKASDVLRQMELIEKRYQSDEG